MKWIKIEPGCQMPDNDSDVLITVTVNRGYGFQKYTDFATYYEDLRYGYIQSANQVGGFIPNCGCDGCLDEPSMKVIAWMEAPEPFEEG